MSSPYYFLSHIDAPKRYLTLTLDELIVAIIGFSLLICSNQRIIAALLSVSLLFGLRSLKKGRTPKILFVLAYWHLPAFVTQFFLPKLPRSHYRGWIA